MENIIQTLLDQARKENLISNGAKEMFLVILRDNFYIQHGKIYSKLDFDTIKFIMDISKSTIQRRLEELVENGFVEKEKEYQKPIKIIVGKENKSGNNLQRKFFIAERLAEVYRSSLKSIPKKDVITAEVVQNVRKNKTMDSKNYINKKLFQKIVDFFNSNFNGDIRLNNKNKNMLLTCYNRVNRDDKEFFNVYRWFVNNYKKLNFIKSYPTILAFYKFFDTILRQYTEYNELADGVLELFKEMSNYFTAQINIKSKENFELIHSVNKCIEIVNGDIELVKKVYFWYVDNYQKIKFLRNYPEIPIFTKFFTTLLYQYNNPEEIDNSVEEQTWVNPLDLIDA